MRLSRIVLLAVGSGLLVVAGGWRPLVAPQLTKLPASLNESVQYAGTYTGYVNQATGATLAAPQRLPLTINRHIKAAVGQGSSAGLVVTDASDLAIGPTTSTAVLQYVLDRSAEKNVKSQDAYALAPGNVVDRAGTYSLGPPHGTDPARSYPLWTDEIGRAIPLTSAHATQTIHGVAVQRWQLNLPATTMVTPTVTAMHLPVSLPFAAFEAGLKAKGIDLAAAFRALSPSLTPAQRKSLAAQTAKPIRLDYLYATHAQLLIEPSTGAIVDVVTDVRSYSVRPNLTGLVAGLTPIIAAHFTNPVVTKLLAAGGQLTSPPARPLYTLTFHQTPASVAATAGTAGHNASQLKVISLWVPIGLAVTGVILIGSSLAGRRRAGHDAITPAHSGSQQPVA
jgi:Porin PorA